MIFSLFHFHLIQAQNKTHRLINTVSALLKASHLDWHRNQLPFSLQPQPATHTGHLFVVKKWFEASTEPLSHWLPSKLILIFRREREREREEGWKAISLTCWETWSVLISRDWLWNALWHSAEHFNGAIIITHLLFLSPFLPWFACHLKIDRCLLSIDN